MDANSASPLDPEELGGLIAELVHEHVERALPVVIGKVQSSIELPEPLAGKDGRDGLNGKDGAPGERGDIGASGEPGQPGRDGIDGKDADPEAARVIAAEAVTEFVEGFGKALAARFADAT